MHTIVRSNIKIGKMAVKLLLAILIEKGEKYKNNISNFVFFSEIVELNFSDRIQLRVF